MSFYFLVYHLQPQHHLAPRLYKSRLSTQKIKYDKRSSYFIYLDKVPDKNAERNFELWSRFFFTQKQVFKMLKIDILSSWAVIMWREHSEAEGGIYDNDIHRDNHVVSTFSFYERCLYKWVYLSYDFILNDKHLLGLVYVFRWLCTYF